MRYKTVFDINFGKEDRGTLDGGLLENVPDDSKMILRKYNTEVFEPRPEDLPAVSPEEIRDLVTRAMRMSHTRRFNFYPIFLKVAAVFVFAGAIFFAYSIRENNGNMKMLQQAYADAKKAINCRDAARLLECALNIQGLEKKGVRLESAPTGDALLRCTAIFASSQKDTKVLNQVGKSVTGLHTDHMQLAMVTRGESRKTSAVFPKLNMNDSESRAILSAYKTIPEKEGNVFASQISFALQNLDSILLCKTAIQLKQYESSDIKEEYRAETLLHKSFDMAFALNDLESLEKMLVLYKQSPLYRQHEYNVLTSEMNYLKNHKATQVLQPDQVQVIRVWLQQEKGK